MKKLYLSLLLLGLTAIFSDIAAQKKDSIQGVYRRSSLTLLLMDEQDMPHREVIREAFITAPLPDKFNDHNLAIRCFDPLDYPLSSSDTESYQQAVKGSNQPKKKGKGFGNFMKGAALVALSAAGSSNESSSQPSKPVIIDTEKKETYGAISNKYLLEQHVGKQLFDQWFLDSLGNFSMEKVKQRGLYDASVMDVQTAKNSVRGMGMLEDAGEELIKNTFVVVSRFRFLSKDELVQEIDAVTQSIASSSGNEYAQLAADAVTIALKASLGSGHYVRTTSFLFQLEWSDSIANTFYSIWDNREAYDAADFFKLKYIGQEAAFAGVKAGVFTKLDQSELIRIATVNATDAVLAKLQKKYDVFKTKTPLNSVDPLSAYIGMKEGVEPGDHFEVLERVVDPETNRTSYVRKGTVKVAKGKVWDNRYMADQEAQANGEEVQLTATEFEGGKHSYYPGLLLRQIK